MNKEYWGLTATIVGSLFAFYIMTKQEMSVIREQANAQISATNAQIALMNEHHRQDIQRSEEKWERLFEKFLPPLQENKK